MSPAYMDGGAMASYIQLHGFVHCGIGYIEVHPFDISAFCIALHRDEIFILYPHAVYLEAAACGSNKKYEKQDCSGFKQHFHFDPAIFTVVILIAYTI